MGLLLAAVIAEEICLYCRKKRVKKRLTENHLAPCKRCGCAAGTKTKSCLDCGRLLPSRNLALDLALCALVIYSATITLSEFTSGNDASELTEKGMFESEIVEHTSTYIPNLQPAGVYLSLEEVGFTTDENPESEGITQWTSELYKDGIEYHVELISDDPRRVQCIRGTAINIHRNPHEVEQFFKFLASSLFLGGSNKEGQLNEWVDTNFSSGDTVTSVGGVNVTLSAPSSMVRSIVINAGPTSGR